jgi:NAD(P)-dependent dehydrogenase (short-subunit alcohol dehydrogenase family)
MAEEAGCVVVVGGSSGLGRHIARRFVDRGEAVVITSRDAVRAAAVAGELGGGAVGVQIDLAEPEGIAGALAGVGPVRHLVLSAIERDSNTAAGYDISQALHLVTLKLVGYTEVVHALLPRLSSAGSVLLFGGQAKERPYPGSTTVSTVNGGVVGMVATLAVELQPIRVNAIHPGIVGDSPYWAARPPEVLQAVLQRTPTGRLVTMADVVSAVEFLLDNPGVNGVNLAVDGGWLLS